MDDDILKKEALSFLKILFQKNDYCCPQSMVINTILRISDELYQGLMKQFSCLRLNNLCLL